MSPWAIPVLAIVVTALSPMPLAAQAWTGSALFDMGERERAYQCRTTGRADPAASAEALSEIERLVATLPEGASATLAGFALSGMGARARGVWVTAEGRPLTLDFGRRGGRWVTRGATLGAVGEPAGVVRAFCERPGDVERYIARLDDRPHEEGLKPQ